MLPALDAIGAAWSACPDRVSIIDRSEWTNLVASAVREGITVTGDSSLRQLSSSQWLDRSVSEAVGVGAVAMRASLLGQWSSPYTLVPRYLKLSAAEEKAVSRTQLKSDSVED